MANKTYYTLAVLHKFKNGMRWTPEFGDYERPVVVQELADTRDDWEDGTKFLIITTDETQAAINAKIDELNKELFNAQAQA